jgi:hypothetical protein
MLTTTILHSEFNVMPVSGLMKSLIRHMTMTYILSLSFIAHISILIYIE